MQFVHGDLRTRAQHLLDGVRPGDDGVVDHALLVLSRLREHVVHDFALAAGVIILALVVWVLNGLGVLVPGLGGFLHDVVQVMGKTQK